MTNTAERRIPFAYTSRENLYDHRSIKSRIFYSRERLLKIREKILSEREIPITEDLVFYSASRATGEHEVHTRYVSLYYYSPEDNSIKIQREVFTSDGKIAEYNSTIENDV